MPATNHHSGDRNDNTANKEQSAVTIIITRHYGHAGKIEDCLIPLLAEQVAKGHRD